MRNICIAAVSAVASIAFVGCASSQEEGVKTNKLQQYTTVAADTMTTTDAAKSVLESHGYTQVTGKSDKDVGEATATMADNTKIKVSIAKKATAISEVTVKVGTFGDNTLGAKLTNEIKTKAQGMKMDSTTTPSPSL